MSSTATKLEKGHFNIWYTNELINSLYSINNNIGGINLNMNKVTKESQKKKKKKWKKRYLNHLHYNIVN